MGKTLQHVGVLGMKWGHHKSGGESGGGSKHPSNAAAIKTADQLEAIRKQRSRGTKVKDYFLSGSRTNKLYSERHGTGEIAKKGAQLQNKLDELRKQRTRGQKIVDALMTPEASTKMWSEMDSKSRKRALYYTGAALALSAAMAAM